MRTAQTRSGQPAAQHYQQPVWRQTGHDQIWSVASRQSHTTVQGHKRFQRVPSSPPPIRMHTINYATQAWHQGIIPMMPVNSPFSANICKMHEMSTQQACLIPSYHILMHSQPNRHDTMWHKHAQQAVGATIPAQDHCLAHILTVLRNVHVQNISHQKNIQTHRCSELLNAHT